MFDDDIGLARALVGDAQHFVIYHFHGKRLKALGVAALFLKLFQIVAHVLGQFALRRRTTQHAGQEINRLVLGFVKGHRRARQIRQLAHLVQYGAPHPAQGKAFKFNTLGRVKGACSLQKANHADLHQLIELHERGNTHLQVQSHPFDHAQMGHDQGFAGIMDLIVELGGDGHRA